MNAKRLPSRTTALIACWTRWTWDAKQARTIRPEAWLTISSSRSPTVVSDGTKPGRSAFV